MFYKMGFWCGQDPHDNRGAQRGPFKDSRVFKGKFAGLERGLAVPGLEYHRREHWVHVSQGSGLEETVENHLSYGRIQVAKILPNNHGPDS